MKVKKGDLLRYTGDYAPEVPDNAKYGNGRVVSFHNNRFHGREVTVRLVDENEELYADWPLSMVEIVREF